MSAREITAMVCATTECMTPADIERAGGVGALAYGTCSKCDTGICWKAPGDDVDKRFCSACAAAVMATLPPGAAKVLPAASMVEALGDGAAKGAQQAADFLALLGRLLGVPPGTDLLAAVPVCPETDKAIADFLTTVPPGWDDGPSHAAAFSAGIAAIVTMVHVALMAEEESGRLKGLTPAHMLAFSGVLEACEKAVLKHHGIEASDG